MRFRRGSRVEVFSIKEASYGVWRSAEIISGNGHTYNVRYYSFEIANNEVVEDRVPRKIIRPCPPQVDVDRWEAGELVEVLDNNISWKTATVLEVLSGRYYVVRLLGAKAELTVHKVYLRARQSWQDERWVMIGKTSVASLRVLKRPSPCDWAESAESCTRSPKKIRSLEEEGHQHRFASSSAQKVYNDSSERRGVELYVKASCNENKSGFRQMVRMVPTLVVVMLNLQKKHLDAEMKLGENIHYQPKDNHLQSAGWISLPTIANVTSRLWNCPCLFVGGICTVGLVIKIYRKVLNFYEIKAMTFQAELPSLKKLKRLREGEEALRIAMFLCHHYIRLYSTLRKIIELNISDSLELMLIQNFMVLQNL
ncbi:putative Agenet-like domain-containing protein [Arabidopsis thaliana]